MFWKEDFLNRMRDYWLKRITKIQYYGNNKWYDAKITSKLVEGNALRITSQTNDGEAMHITKVRILDSKGNVIGETTENITKSNLQNAITIWKFPLYEVEGDGD